MVLAGIVGIVGPAYAQQTDADFGAYCRANYSYSSDLRPPNSSRKM